MNKILDTLNQIAGTIVLLCTTYGIILICVVVALLLAGCAANDLPILDPERAEFCENYENDLPSVNDTEHTAHVVTRNLIRVEELCNG